MKTYSALGIAAAGLFAAILALTPLTAIQASENTASAADVKRETAELLQALKSYGAEQRDEALEKSRAALQNIDRRIEALEADMLERWDEMDQTAREQARESLQALREQRTRVAEWYGSMKSGTVSAWGEIKQGFANAYQALHEAWEQSERDLHSEERQ